MHESPTPPARLPQVGVLYAVFFASGFCGLVYESIWSHYLKLLLGHAAYGQAVVLVVFVGGLALGAWLTGRFTHRIARPVLAYAIVEALVALLAFGFQGVFERASAWALDWFLPAACGGAGPCLASWLLAAALILPASVLLGTTFPLMTAGVLRLGVAEGRGLSLLYFLNSLGAAIGVLVAGFLLRPALGLPGTILLAGALNALVAFAAWACDRSLRAREAPIIPPAAPTTSAPGSAADLQTLLAVAAITGLSSFIYEVVWIRMLTLVLGAATHSFELMLAPFILGLALGAWWVQRRIDATDALRLLARIQVAMGVLAVATLPLYAGSFDLMARVLAALARNEPAYLAFHLASGLIAAAVMLPAAICAGMTLPLITVVLLRAGHGERQIGQVYGVNTFGAIVGVLAAVHVLIPQLGLKWSLAVAAGIDVALGIVLWRMAAAREVPAPVPARRWLPVAVGAAAMVVVAAIPLAADLDPSRLSSGVFRHGRPRLEQHLAAIQFHQDGKTASVTVVEDRNNGVRALYTNGKSDGATHPSVSRVTQDDRAMVFLAALGPLHHPQARTAAVVGLGTGTTSAVLLESPNLTLVETVEIEPAMVKAAELFRPRNAKVFDDRRSRIVVDDARAHFAKSRAQFDIIVSEPSNPWVSGVAGLFTQEFYRSVAQHLAPDGHFVQWLHLYEASPELVASILGAFTSVFPEFRAYAANDADVVLVARRDGRVPELQVAAAAGMPGMLARLAELGVDTPAMLAAHEAGPGSALRLLARSWAAPPNSDFFPYVENRAAADRFQGRFAAPLLGLRNEPVPVLEFIHGPAPETGSWDAVPPRTPPHLRARFAGIAGQRFLRGESLPPDQQAWLGHLTGDYALMRSWLVDCRFPPDTGVLWPSLVRVASELNRALDAAAAGAFWKDVLAGKCAKALTPTQRTWLELFAGVGARQPATVYPAALQVLRSDAQLQPASRAYATMAAVAAAVALDRRREAADLLAEQRRRLPHEQLESPGMRYVTMLVASRPAAP